jgi:hypothetical protein
MTITSIALTGSDERGYTAEFEQMRTGKHLLLFRKAGTVNGRHYHKGLSATKDPEQFIIIHGTCRLSWRHIDETEMQTVVITGPAKLEIPPFTWHEIVTETDCTFLELNSLEEHVADTFYLS